jgi:hypothetical protein
LGLDAIDRAQLSVGGLEHLARPVYKFLFVGQKIVGNEKANFPTHIASPFGLFVAWTIMAEALSINRTFCAPRTENPPSDLNA